MCVMIPLMCLLLMVSKEAFSMPSGAPVEACDNMAPGHKGTLPQSLTSALYEVKATMLTGSTEEYQITVTGKTGNEKFKGFFLQARASNNVQNSQAMGTWDVTSAGVANQLMTLKAVSCHAIPSSAVTHSDNSVKSKVLLKWLPPPNMSGNVTFVATVVENFTTYWVGIMSDTVMFGLHQGGVGSSSNISSAGGISISSLSPIVIDKNATTTSGITSSRASNSSIVEGTVTSSRKTTPGNKTATLPHPVIPPATTTSKHSLNKTDQSHSKSTSSLLKSQPMLWFSICFFSAWLSRLIWHQG